MIFLKHKIVVKGFLLWDCFTFFPFLLTFDRESLVLEPSTFSEKHKTKKMSKRFRFTTLFKKKNRSVKYNNEFVVELVQEAKNLIPG